MIIYSSFDEFWAVNYEGQFGQGVVAEVFKEVAEKAWVEATLAAAKVCGQAEGNAEETGMASNFDCEVTLVGLSKKPINHLQSGDKVMVKFAKEDQFWVFAEVDKVDPRLQSITVFTGEGERSVQVGIYRPPYQHEIISWPQI